MEKLKRWWSGLSASQKAEVASRIGVAKGSLSNVICGAKLASPLVAAGLEIETGGVVTRKELRPSDWHAIWLELRDRAPTAPNRPSVAGPL